jgi:hypothetical protein
MPEPQVVTAQDGDTLCTLGIAAGFKDCTELRTANPTLVNRPLVPGDNVTIPAIDPGDHPRATDATHVFKRTARQVAIRFVHGSKDRAFKDDLEKTELNVSNYITDKGGNPDGDQDFPDQSVNVFNASADQDTDSFKVEVLDTRPTGNPLKVEVQPLRPVYSAADATGQTITDLVEFPAAEKARRGLLTLDAAKQGGTKRFRTCYLRLVTDDADNKSVFGGVAAGGFPPATNNSGRVQQTILATDMTDEGDPQVQILDQVVQAKYTLTDCPGSPKCCVVKRATIGTDRQRLRIAVHILRRTVGGTPVATIAEADRRVTRWLRRIFAQAAIAPKLAQPTREVDPVANLIAVSEPGTNAPANSGGLTASGLTAAGAASQHQFRISAAGKTPQLVGPLTPVDPGTAAPFTALQAANALAALVADPYTATVTQNPQRFNDTLGSVDILIKEKSGLAVTIDQLPSAAQADTFQTLTLGSVNPLPVPLQGWDGFNFLAGSIQQRVILKNYDSGDDRVDIFIIDTHVSGDRGEAMMSGDEVFPAAPAISGVKFSVFMIRDAVRNPGNPDNDPLVLAHEITHVTAEILHTDQQGAAFASSRPNPYQLMAQQVTGNESPGASKRLRDGPCVYAQGAGLNVNIVSRLRTKGSTLMESW